MSTHRGTYKRGSLGYRRAKEPDAKTAQSAGGFAVQEHMPCVYKGSYICDDCGTTRRAPRLGIWARADCRSRDMVGRAEHLQVSPTCPRCREGMRLLPQGIKLRRYLRKIRRRP